MVEEGGLDLARVIKDRARLWLTVAMGLLCMITITAVSRARPNDSMEILSLDAALARALEKHPTIDSARSTLESSELAVARRSAAYSPTLSASGRPLSLSVKQDESKLALGESVSIDGSVSTIQGWRLSATWQEGDRTQPGLKVDASLRIWPPAQYSTDYLNLLESKESATLAAQKVARARKQAMIDIYRRYRSLQIDRVRLLMDEQNHEAKLMLYNRVVAKAEQGLASTVEVLSAQQEEAESLASYQRALRNYQGELRSFLLDLSIEEGSVELEPLPDALHTSALDFSLEEAVALALEADITLMERDRELTAAQRQTDVVRTRKGMELSLGGSAKSSGSQTREPEYLAYIAFSYPLMDGGLKELEKREADLALQQAEEAVETQKVKVRSEVEDKLSELQWLEDQMYIADLNLEKVKIQHKAKVSQASDGLIREEEVEGSNRLMLQAKLDWLESVVAYETARLELMVLTGQAMNIEGGYPN